MTRVYVPEQRFWVNQAVPRAVATLSLPWVRKRPPLSRAHRLGLRLCLCLRLVGATARGEQPPAFPPCSGRGVIPPPLLRRAGPEFRPPNLPGRARPRSLPGGGRT